MSGPIFTECARTAPNRTIDAFLFCTFLRISKKISISQRLRAGCSLDTEGIGRKSQEKDGSRFCTEVAVGEPIGRLRFVLSSSLSLRLTNRWPVLQEPYRQEPFLVDEDRIGGSAICPPPHHCDLPITSSGSDNCSTAPAVLFFLFYTLTPDSRSVPGLPDLLRCTAYFVYTTSAFVAVALGIVRSAGPAQPNMLLAAYWLRNCWFSISSAVICVVPV